MARHPADGSENDNANANASDLLAEVESLKRRLAALEQRLPGDISKEKRRASTKTVVCLTTGAMLAMLAGASVVQSAVQDAVDALTIDSNGVANFAGKRNNFSDVENAGKLRVGAAWGVPGIYSEQGPVVVGSQNGNIWLYGKVGIGADKKAPSQSLDVAGTVVADTFSGKAANLTQSLTVEGAATLNTSLTVEGDTTLKGPMKIDGKNTLEFGAGVSGKQVDAGKIGYQTWTTDALDIVGAGTTTRKIKFWAEGGATFNGGLNVSGAVDGNMKVIYQRDDDQQKTYEKPLWRYHMSLTAAKYGGRTKTIPNEILAKLCGKPDGCEVRLGMTRWDDASKTQTASISNRLYIGDNGRWRVSWPRDTEGVIGNGRREDAMNAWNTCLLTDATFDNYQDKGDRQTGLQLLVWKDNNNPARTCELTLLP